MIFFLDKNHPTFIARKEFKEVISTVPEDASGTDRIRITNQFLDQYYCRYNKWPAPAVIERLANFILKPYIGRKDEEYKILSVYTLERHRSREQVYRDSYDDYYEQ